MAEPVDEPGDDVVRKVDEVTKALEELAAVLEEDDLSALLGQVCRQAIHAVPGADVASVSILRADAADTVAATDELAVKIDKAQYSAGEGPCLEAAATRQVVHVRVSEVRSRWPGFAEAAGAAAVASYLSAPLIIDQRYQGSLNLYGFDEHGFGRLDAALLELYTTAAGSALLSAGRYLRMREHVDQLRRALVSRAVIDQAKGVIMAARRVSAEEAFALLVEQSQRDNVKLRDLAQQFINDITAT